MLSCQQYLDVGHHQGALVGARLSKQFIGSLIFHSEWKVASHPLQFAAAGMHKFRLMFIEDGLISFQCTFPCVSCVYIILPIMRSSKLHCAGWTHIH